MHFPKIVTAVFLLLSSSLLTVHSFAEPHTFDFDKRHSEIQFEWDHLGASKSVGHFNDYEGNAVIDLEKPENSVVDIRIKTNSLSTGLPELDDHLSQKVFLQASSIQPLALKANQ